MAEKARRKIREAFRGKEDDNEIFTMPERTKTKLELESAEEPSMEAEEAGYEETQPLKSKITRSIIKMLKKKGPPSSKADR